MSSKDPRKPQPPVGHPSDARGIQSLIDAHTTALKVRNYSADTISQRDKYLRWFALWCAERGITRPGEVTKPVIERYQRHLYFYRNDDGKPLSFRSQYQHLSHVRAWFKWLARENQMLFNPASEIELPKVGMRLTQSRPLRQGSRTRVVATRHRRSVRHSRSSHLGNVLLLRHSSP